MSESSPFALLGLEPSFGLTAAELARRQKELSAELHPDRVASRPAAERREALGRAIEVNAAYRRLKDAVGRAEALLEEHGVVLSETTEPPADPAFLMEMMEAREQLRDWGKAEDLDAIEAAIVAFRKKELAAEQVLAALFETFEPGSEEQVLAVRKAIAPLRYFRRYFDEANAYLDELS